MAAGAPRDGLTYQALRTLADLDPAIAEVTGWTRYRIEGRPEAGDARIVALDRGGVAAGIPSRTDQDPRLRGTKNRVATERQVLVATRPPGRAPDRPRPRDEGRPDHRSDAAARALPGPGLGRHRPRACSRATRTATPCSGTRSPRPSRPSVRTCWPSIDVADLLVASITSLADRFRSEG